MKQIVLACCATMFLAVSMGSEHQVETLFVAGVLWQKASAYLG